MLTLDNRTALLIIDVQVGLDDPSLGERNNPDAEAHMARLLAAWRAAGRPVYHVQHMSTNPHSTLRPGQPGNAIKPALAPEDDEPLIQKTVNSAFIGTDLADRLRAAGITTLVIVGLTTEHCISTSARMASNLGFTTIVVADATAAHAHPGYDGTPYSAATIHAVELATLHGEFALVLTTDQILAQASQGT